MTRPTLRLPILAISFAAFATIPFAFFALGTESLRATIFALAFGLVGLAIARRPRLWKGFAWIASAVAVGIGYTHGHLLDAFAGAVAPFGLVMVVGGIAFGWACLIALVVKGASAVRGPEQSMA